MIYLGLGSNCGDRRRFLETAIEQLQQGGFELDAISPIVESPALLKADARPQWNKPFLNLVVRGASSLSPQQMLSAAKQIEQRMGRDLDAPPWSPRNIDIDILLWGDHKISTPDLTIPHPEMHKRAFVITPLMHLDPHLKLPNINLTPLQISEQIRPIPLWMGIVNLSTDSFSDGGENSNTPKLEQRLDEWINEGVQILDFGAESTRPNAQPVSANEEWARLKPAFSVIERLRKKHALMPLISIDTRHAQTAETALQQGADWINDVSGLSDPQMMKTIHAYQAGAVAMHSLSVPVVPGETLPNDRPVSVQLLEWLDQHERQWLAAGLNPGGIVFDPGIGFGKSVLQNLEIMKSISSLRRQGFRVLAGHSRKSFMSTFCGYPAADRDMETLGLSLAMCEQGVDILRVHDPLMHIRAYRAWAHAQR